MRHLILAMLLTAGCGVESNEKLPEDFDPIEGAWIGYEIDNNGARKMNGLGLRIDLIHQTGLNYSAKISIPNHVDSTMHFESNVFDDFVRLDSDGLTWIGVTSDSLVLRNYLRTPIHGFEGNAFRTP